MKRRILSLMFALALCLSLLPATALAVGVKGVSYTYYEWDSSTHSLTETSGTAATATEVEESSTTWSAGWYVVNKDVTIDQRVTVSGDVHLILADGYTLTVKEGITVNGTNKLTIYAQSTDENEMGKLKASTLSPDTNSFPAAIGGDTNRNNGNSAGTITIYGGIITAEVSDSTGNIYGAAIGGGGGNKGGDGGTIKIYSGVVNASVVSSEEKRCSYGAAIGGGGSSGKRDKGGSGGSITIYGGTVNATVSTQGKGPIVVSCGAAIGGGGSEYKNPGGDGGTIQIYGGTICAKVLSSPNGESNGKSYGAAIGGGGSDANSAQGGNGGAGGAIQIYGGSIDAIVSAMGAGGEVYGAAIGGGGSQESGKTGGAGGNILIQGGTINAVVSHSGTDGKVGAAIGGGGSMYGTAGGKGNFSTGTNGNAVIFASSSNDNHIQDISKQNEWQGVIFQGTDGQVYGTETLTQDLTIPSGKNLCIETDKKLTIPERVILSFEKGAKLTNNGELIIDHETCLTGEGNLTGSEDYFITNPNPVFNPTSLTYDGTDQSEKLKPSAPTESVKVMSQDFKIKGSPNYSEWRITSPTSGIVNSGTYEVVAQNKDGTREVTDKVTVLPAALTITGATVDKTYDGNKDATVTDVTFSGLQNGETLTLGTDYTAAAVFDDADAGENKDVTVTVILINGNYTFQNSEGTAVKEMTYKSTANISPKKHTLTLTPDKTSLTGDGTVKLTLTGLPDGGTGTATVTGKDSEGKSVTVTKGENNTWTATLPNRTMDYTFTAQYTGDSNYYVDNAQCEVKVTQLVDKVCLDQSKLALHVGDSGTLTATVTPENGYDQSVTWTTSDAAVATVENGKVTAVGLGTATITATAGADDNKSAECTVTVGYQAAFLSQGEQAAEPMLSDGAGTVILPAAPSRAGYSFRGWYAGGTLYAAGEEVTLTGDTTFVAQWSDNTPYYTITVKDADNGTVTCYAKSAAKGADVTLTVKADVGYQLDKLTVTDASGNVIDVEKVNNATYTFVMPGSKVTVEAVFAPTTVVEPSGLPFTDVSTSDWFYSAVKFVYENGLMDGVGNNLFAPNATLNRAMAVTILYRLEGSPAVTTDAGFNDVAAGTWYTDAVNWAAANNIVNGVEGNNFDPTGSLTREQMATVLYRYAQYKGADVSASGDIGGFVDSANVSSWAADAVKWAVGSGLVNGVEGNALAPQGTSTRAQAATVLMRFVG